MKEVLLSQVFHMQVFSQIHSKNILQEVYKLQILVVYSNTNFDNILT